MNKGNKILSALIIVLSTVLSLSLASLLYAQASQLSLPSENVERIGGTNQTLVSRGYVVFNGLLVNDTYRGFASPYVDRVIVIYSLRYNEDAGDHDLGLIVENRGEFILRASGTVNFPDNTTYLVFYIDLGTLYNQGVTLIGVTAANS